MRVGRILARVAPGTSSSEKAAARGRAQQFLRRLKAGEDFVKVQAAGDGPERARAGELGFLARGDLQDARLEAAAFGLQRPGALSEVVESSEGFAVLRLIERREARLPPFEEVRAEVEGRLAPTRQRKVFDELRRRLRAQGDVKFETAATR